MPAWTFTQKTGDRKRLVLDGQFAPHGRPRKSPVVEDGIGQRNGKVYYPGNRKPTRHLFGVMHTDWVLQGRFMDRDLGPGGANEKASLIKTMIDDGQELTIEWGDVLAATGIFLEFLPSRESTSQIAWKLTIGIDSDDGVSHRSIPLPERSINVALTVMLRSLASVSRPKLPADIEFEPGFIESLDNLISSIASISANAISVANGIDNLERASFHEVQRLRASVNQLQTATATLNRTYDTGLNDLAVIRANAVSDAQWSQTRTESVASLYVAMALLADIDRQLSRVQIGTANRTHRVVGGDTWERLSTQYYGGPSKADTLRQANRARYGQKPQANRILHIPKP